MKTKILHAFIVIALFVSATFTLCAQEDAEAPTFSEEEEYVHEKVWETGPTFYQQVVDFFEQHGVTVTSVIDKPFYGNSPELLSEIATAFQVSECALRNVNTVGDVLCRIMEQRYNGPHSEIMDFERIQYSSWPPDFKTYMEHYPNSPRWREAYEKYMVTFLVSSWNYAMHYNSVRYCKDFLDKYREFSDNYCWGLTYYSKTSYSWLDKEYDESAEKDYSAYSNWDSENSSAAEYYRRSRTWKKADDMIKEAFTLFTDPE